MTKPHHAAVTWIPTLELILAAGAAGLWYTQGGWVEYAGSFHGALPLLLLVVMWSLRRITTRGRAAVPPPFLGPLVLFLATAATSLWAAYDLQIAGAKAWLLVGALGFYWALAHQPDHTRIVAACALLLMGGAGVAALSTLTSDWSTTSIAGTVIARAAEAAGGLLPAALAAETLNANVAGAIYLLTLPLSVPLIAAARQDGTRWRSLWIGGTCALAAVTLVGLLLTGSRGAYVALVAAGALWGALRLSASAPPDRRRIALAALAGLAIIGVGLALYIVSIASPSPNAESAPSSLRNRLWLWQLGFSLVRDMPFTGIGVGMFEMMLTLYSLLIHVGFVEHAHNLYLDVAIEQGVLGAAALVTMSATALVWGVRALWSRPETARSGEQPMVPNPGHQCMLEAALVSLSTLLVHGLIDDAIYGSRGIVLLLVPFGLLVAVIRGQHTSSAKKAAGRDRPLRHFGVPVLANLALTVFVVGGIVAASGSGGTASASRLRATWHANRGAVEQARAELAEYDQERFSERSIGEVRRQQDLSAALGCYARALSLAPGNRTALLRQGMIALDRFEYDQALEVLQSARDAGHRDRVTRMLYGDALVAVGQVEDAVRVTGGLPFARARMLGQAWERYRSRGDDERAAFAYAAAESLE